MKGFKWIVPVLAMFLLMGCISTSIYSVSKTAELARFKDESGNTEIYQLKRKDGVAMLVVRTEKARMRPDLGLTLKEINKQLAQEKMLTPYKGLFVHKLIEGGSGAEAGILPGDILIQVNGLDVIYMDQYNHALLHRTDPEKGVEVKLLRGFGEMKELGFTLVPDMKQATSVSTRAIPLEGTDGSRTPFVGMVINTLPAEYTEKIYGEQLSTVLVSSVVIGSPGYRAGLRTGDRIVSVNGSRFETAAELHDWIQMHGPRGEIAEFEIFNSYREGTFKTEVALDDYDAHHEVRLPLLFNLENEPHSTDWGIGPFSLIFDYESDYYYSSSREPNYSRGFSLLFGLFGREWGPRWGKTRILWFITFRSS
ncbi:MAG: PDZ domain-containing protein [Planctomycetota bacterium]